MGRGFLVARTSGMGIVLSAPIASVAVSVATSVASILVSIVVAVVVVASVAIPSSPVTTSIPTLIIPL